MDRGQRRVRGRAGGPDLGSLNPGAWVLALPVLALSVLAVSVPKVTRPEVLVLGAPGRRPWWGPLWGFLLGLSPLGRMRVWARIRVPRVR